jgi:N-formylmethionyl-tRNA deformylase
MNQILYVPDPILRQTSKKIEKITSKEIDISKKMIDLMLKAPGVGLAANQIGILKKIVTINLPNEKNEKNKIYTLFNPKTCFVLQKKS